MSRGECLQLAMLFVVGPAHALACVILAAIGWWRAPRWSLEARFAVLAPNAVVALTSVAIGFSIGTENRDLFLFARGMLASECLAFLVLTAVLIARRRKSDLTSA